ncbi:sugar 3,4-ketoisomerase [Nonomuraea antri]|uniref:sugar 3,4-ketoisomerase n=1 Tax=Nonomuraea antri TaxID=2730852 RepID=UPI002E2BFA07|nr:FdtA/QdtA family cupin domain-containing protein [Nonomuraea antri]
MVGRIEPCRIVDLTEFKDARGRLSVVESGKDIPFDIKRAYYMYDIPDGVSRGAHGHRRLRQIIIAVAGSFEVVVDDGFDQATFVLDRPDKGLLMGPMVWRDMINYAPGTVGLWLVSEPYDESDYYRDYQEFLRDARELR